MEHQRCYVYQPPETEERPAKRQCMHAHDPHAQLPDRLAVYREVWAQQEQRIQVHQRCETADFARAYLSQDTLEDADSTTQEKIVNFIAASSQGPRFTIPTALVVAGPSIASHGPFFQRLGQKVRRDADSAYICLTSSECPNLKTLLKALVKKATSRIGEDDEDDVDRPSVTSRNGPKLLNYDLGHVLEWQKKSQVSSIVVAIQDSEAFDPGLLADTVDLFQYVSVCMLLTSIANTHPQLMA